jgi:chemotaxis signal transduction protein
VNHPARDEGILRCSVGADQYAFRNGDVQHVARVEHMRDDRATDGRRGTLRLAGQQVAVFALGDVLGRPRVDATGTLADQHIAVTGDRHELVGWLVDRLARTAAPPPGGIAPLPRSIGTPASNWFEALVTFGEGDSALLIAPRHLNPLAAQPLAPDHDAVFAVPAAGDRRADPVAVVFATEVLPPSAACRYALSGRQIAAIVQPTTPIPIPGSASHVRGVMLWRQAVVPVIDFRHAAAQAESPNARRLIAQCGVRGRGSLVAFSIDADVVMHRRGTDYTQLPDLASPPFCSGLFDVNGEPVGLLDLDALTTLH